MGPLHGTGWGGSRGTLGGADLSPALLDGSDPPFDVGIELGLPALLLGRFGQPELGFGALTRNERTQARAFRSS